MAGGYRSEDVAALIVAVEELLEMLDAFLLGETAEHVTRVHEALERLTPSS